MSRSIFLALAALALSGCGDDDGMATPDGGGGGDAGPAPTCADYCTTVMANCTGAAHAQYGDMAGCMMFCETNGGWDPGALGDTAGNTIGCRLYHAGAPAMGDPSSHCPHAGPSGGGVCGTYCENYCQLAADNCMGDNALYATPAECASACEGLAADGMPGATSGDTVQCRIYHLGVAGTDETAAMTHCPHGTVEGGGPALCGSAPTGFDFRTDPISAFARVDRMGMPAVSTALIPTDRKNLYNDSNPSAESDAASTMFAGDIVASLQGLHAALDDDLIAAGLVPCATPAPGGMPNVDRCVGQGAPAIIPDTIRMDTAMPAGFNNGRLFTDPVIDVTLALILLDLTTPGQTLSSLVGTNPTANEQTMPDIANPALFPWLPAPYEM